MDKNSRMVKNSRIEDNEEEALKEFLKRDYPDLLDKYNQELEIENNEEFLDG